MNKKVLMIVAAAMVAVAVGCGRDPEAADVAVQPVAQTKDGQPADNLLLLAVRECWQRCENAYLRDSAHFMDVCSANNHAAFYSMTGISDALRDQVIALQSEKMREFVRLNPNFVPDTMCSDCAENSLAMLGGSVMELCHVMQEIAFIDSTHMYEPLTQLPVEMTDCEAMCFWRSSESSMTLLECLLNCKLNMCINKAYLHLYEIRVTYTDERP
ncbi:MAG: hypothetical protein IJ760_01905 [Bacteroidales bacterium]|nr:hypothetical protein [Bacteroidales bacterium]